MRSTSGVLPRSSPRLMAACGTGLIFQRLRSIQLRDISILYAPWHRHIVRKHGWPTSMLWTNTLIHPFPIDKPLLLFGDDITFVVLHASSIRHDEWERQRRCRSSKCPRPDCVCTKFTGTNGTYHHPTCPCPLLGRRENISAIALCAVLCFNCNSLTSVLLFFVFSLRISNVTRYFHGALPTCTT